MKRSTVFLCAAAILAQGRPGFAQPAAVNVASNTSSTPAATAALTMLEKVCLPLVQGGDLHSVASAAGLHTKDGQWFLPIDDKGRAVLQPPDTANPHVCEAQITHALGAQSSIRGALNAWAKSQKPPFEPVDVLKPTVDPQFKRLASSWAGRTTGGSVDVVLSDLKTLQGKPADGDLDRSVLIVGFTPGNPSTPA